MEKTDVLTNYDNLVKSITYDQLVGYLESNGAKKPCESCGESSWFIMMDGDAKTPLLMQMTSGRNASHAYWQFGSACTNCGNIRLYHANFVAVKIKAAGAGGAS